MTHYIFISCFVDAFDEGNLDMEDLSICSISKTYLQVLLLHGNSDLKFNLCKELHSRLSERLSVSCWAYRALADGFGELITVSETLEGS